MKLVRNNIFETNSSSTHSLTVSKLDDYSKWLVGEMYLDLDHNVLVNHDEYLRIARRIYFINTLLDFDWNNRIVTYKDKIVPYDRFEEDLITDENLNSIPEEEINKYKEDNFYSGMPLTFKEFEGYCDEYGYYLFNNKYEDLGVAAFGYYGEDR